jgi:ribokinase
MYPGGKGANQAVACARLGGDVRFVGRTGRDAFREALELNLRAAGVDVENLIADDEASTGVALITVNGIGLNQIIVASGSNMRLSVEDVEFRKGLIQEAGIVLLQLEIPLDTVVRVAELAHAADVPVILNPAPAQPLPDELLRLVDYLTPNETEAEHLTGIAVTNTESAAEAARHLLGRGVRHILVTMGARGVVLVDHDSVVAYPARAVDAIDTTAAGDAFNGALAFALSQDEPLDVAIRLANTVAAYSVTRAGAQPSMPTRADIELPEFDHEPEVNRIRP